MSRPVRKIRALVCSGAGVSIACGLGAVAFASGDEGGPDSLLPVSALAGAHAEVVPAASASAESTEQSYVSPVDSARVLDTTLSWGVEYADSDPSLALSLVPEDATPVIGIGYRQSVAPSGGSAASDGSSFSNRFYVGASLGISRLEPLSFSDALTVGDLSDLGYRVVAGFDVTRWLSAELYFADLGQAGIDFLGEPVGNVDYLAFGVSAIGYVFNSRSGFGLTSAAGEGLWRREGLSLFVSTGLGALDTDTDIPFEQDHDIQVSFGAGLEYGFSNGIAVRGDITSFDTDAQLFSLSVLKRFGSVPALPLQRASAPLAPVVPAPTVAQPVQPRAEEPASPILLGAGLFAFDKSDLTADAVELLDSLVVTERNTNSTLYIDGHTDSTGPEDYNQGLSERRAKVVFDYLVGAGINPSRMVTRGIGEREPATSNATREGRAQNRRTEIIRR